MFRPGTLAGNALFPIDQQTIAGPFEHRRFSEDVFISILQKGLKCGGNGCSPIGDRRTRWSAIRALVLHDLHDAGAVRIGFVDGNFSGDPDADNEGSGHSYSETNNINYEVTSVLAKLAEGQEEIVFKHVFEFRMQITEARKVPVFLNFNNQLVAIPSVL